MPVFTRHRWEIACQERAKGTDVGKAYVIAGYKDNSSAATVFFQRPEIVERVQEIVQERYEDERKSREVATQEAGIDKDWVFKRLKYLTDLSLQKREIIKGGQVVGHRAADGPTAVKCLTLASQLGGWLVQKHEVGAPGDFARMTDEELSASLLDQARGLGIPEEAVSGLLTFQGDAEDTTQE